jgi:hypothetical protein
MFHLWWIDRIWITVKFCFPREDTGLTRLSHRQFPDCRRGRTVADNTVAR